jgi:hypothetical protein
MTAEQMKIGRLQTELARATVELDILHPTDEDLSVGILAPVWRQLRR